MVDGTLYIATGYPVPGQSSDDTQTKGTITSEADGSEPPTQGGQSNFGTEHGYRTGLQDGTLEARIDGEWVIFATETAKDTLDLTVEGYGYRPD